MPSQWDRFAAILASQSMVASPLDGQALSCQRALLGFQPSLVSVLVILTCTYLYLTLTRPRPILLSLP
jgi:hypothetical protein